MSRQKEPIRSLDSHPIRQVSQPLLDWYKDHARALPWRETKNPYHIWLSEIMLQQTRVEAVIPYYHRFLSALPTIPALAEADDDLLMKLWEGLGYYSRVRNLKKAAQLCVAQYNGELPPHYDALLKLPGFGMYTAGAVASIAFGERVPAVDGNVLRVISRLCAYDEDIMLPAVRKEFFEVLSACMPSDAGAFNQALMDIGATVCIPNGAPSCKVCPLNTHCEAYLNENTTAYPLKRAKDARRIEKRTVLLIERDGKFLLHRRDASGLLASMWEFPNIEDGTTDIPAYCEQLNLQPQAFTALVQAKHIFSHIEWHMTGVYIPVADFVEMDGFIWVTREQMEQEIALPSAFAAFKKAIGGISWTKNA